MRTDFDRWNRDKKQSGRWGNTQYIDKFCRRYNITTLVSKPNGFSNSYTTSMRSQLNNPNMCILIIESMALGIITTRNISCRLKYIEKLRIHTKSHTSNKKTAEVVIINREWDTSRWNEHKLNRFHFWIHNIEGKTIAEIKEYNREFFNESADVAFLEAMIWEPRAKN